MEEKKAPKKRLGQKKEPPEAFMASFFDGLEIYQTKMLVRYFLDQNYELIYIRTNQLVAICTTYTEMIVFTELPRQKLLQSPLPGTFCCLCYQLHSALLQSKLEMKSPYKD